MKAVSKDLYTCYEEKLEASHDYQWTSKWRKKRKRALQKEEIMVDATNPAPQNPKISGTSGGTRFLVSIVHREVQFVPY